jgi:hypothetical protein
LPPETTVAESLVQIDLPENRTNVKGWLYSREFLGNEGAQLAAPGW